MPLLLFFWSFCTEQLDFLLPQLLPQQLPFATILSLLAPLLTQWAGLPFSSSDLLGCTLSLSIMLRFATDAFALLLFFCITMLKLLSQYQVKPSMFYYERLSGGNGQGKIMFFQEGKTENNAFSFQWGNFEDLLSKVSCNV